MDLIVALALAFILYFLVLKTTVPSAAELELLQYLVTTINSDGLKVRLFKNDVTPDDNTVIGDLTEADFEGYAAGDLANLTTPGVVAAQAQTQGDSVTFTMGTPGTTNNIYGHYITDSAGTVLYGVVRDPSAPIAMDTAGKEYTVFPVLTLRDKAKCT